MTNTPIALPKGFRFAATACGIKASGKLDVSIFVSDHPCAGAAVTTQNKVVAAPVLLCRKRTPSDNLRAIVVNSGNANACTGTQGDADAVSMCELTEQALGIESHSSLVMSTGVIGRKLPMDKVKLGITTAAAAVGDSEESFLAAADGILTTDQGRKVHTRKLSIGDSTITIAAVAKGAGMIGPNMATMLCVVMTDACLKANDAQRLLQATADLSFNNVSVEGHTSTNDTMALLANGACGGPPLSGEDLETFHAALTEACIELAKLIPADGEGASRLIEVRVSGAEDNASARAICDCVASSNLVKTAICGCDPNWGRIVSAAGYAPVNIENQNISLSVNGIELYKNGEPIAFDETAASKAIAASPTAVIELTVGHGSGQCTHWTSDLTVDYVRFNSEYTT